MALGGPAALEVLLGRERFRAIRGDHGYDTAGPAVASRKIKSPRMREDHIEDHAERAGHDRAAREREVDGRDEHRQGGRRADPDPPGSCEPVP